MFGWSMKLFRVCGTQIEVHASFVLLLAYVAWEGWKTAAWLGLTWSVSYIALLFTCVTLHEFGHATAARRFGINVPRILLLPFGGVAQMDAIPRRPREEIIVALAGPAVNLVIIAGLMLGVRFPEGWDAEYFPLTGAELMRHLVAVNVVMGLFNLIPVFPMDGGRVWRALLASRLPYLKATRIAVVTGQILAGIGAVVMVYFFQNYLGAVLFGFIGVAAEKEWRALQQREREEAHWREFFKRAQVTPGVSVETPPISTL
jgi:Zn-dependent protease